MSNHIFPKKPVVYEIFTQGSGRTAGAPTFAINQNGLAWAWGYNKNACLGQNNTTNKSSPVSVICSLLFSQMTTGSYTVIGGLQADTGTAWVWGTNNAGQLGQNSTSTTKSSPVSVVGGKTFTRIAGATNTFCAIDTGGAAWCWGSGTVGTCGNSSTANRSSPVAVVGSKVFASVVGANNAFLALDTAGAAWGWGPGTNGQLGNNATAGQSSPVAVVGSKTFTKLGMGFGTTAATGVGLEKTTGLAWTWGYGNYGQLGNNATAPQSSPVSVVGGKSFVDIAVGANHMVALDSSGVAWVWGQNLKGQLGTNSTAAASSPVSVVGGKSFVQVMAGNRVSFGMDGTGVLWAWGYNNIGQLGTNSTSPGVSSPVTVALIPNFGRI